MKGTKINTKYWIKLFIFPIQPQVIHNNDFRIVFFAHFSANNNPLFSYWLLGGFAGNTIPSSFVTKMKVRWSEESYGTWIKSLRFLFRVFLSVNYSRMRVSQRHLDHLIQFVYRFVSKTLTKWFVVLSICWH